MRKITVMFIMLLGGIINAQTFDFGCTAPLTGADADNSLYAQTQGEADALTAGERRTSRSDEFNALGTPSDLDIELKWIKFIRSICTKCSYSFSVGYYT